MQDKTKTIFLFGAAFLAAAYIAKSQTQDNTPTNYIKTFYPVALKTQSIFKVPALFTVAQAGLESTWGTSDLAKRSNNHFGIKADPSWKGPQLNGFRVYKTPRDSYLDHAKFLSGNARYRSAFNVKDPGEFAKLIADAGYAGPDKEYASKIESVINKVRQAI